jgi:hypothetical protein
MKRKSIAMLAAALCTLAITVTALAAELINAEQARSIAAQWVPAGSTHLVTKDESFEFVPHYDVKFYDNKTNTAYEIEVLRNGGKVREFKMEAQTALGSHKIVLSVNDVQNLVRKEFPNPFDTKSDISFFKEEKSKLENYKNIDMYLKLINEFECDLYEGAVVPVALARKHTVISLKPGSQVLDLLTKSKL